MRTAVLFVVAAALVGQSLAAECNPTGTGAQTYPCLVNRRTTCTCPSGMQCKRVDTQGLNIGSTANQFCIGPGITCNNQYVTRFSAGNMICRANFDTLCTCPDGMACTGTTANGFCKPCADNFVKGQYDSDFISSPVVQDSLTTEDACICSCSANSTCTYAAYATIVGGCVHGVYQPGTLCTDSELPFDAYIKKPVPSSIPACVNPGK